MDYSIQGAFQQLAHRQKIKDTDHLKQVLNSWWDTISQELINAAVDKWSKRLLLVICSQGGHTEHQFVSLVMSPVLMFSEFFTYQLPYKQHLITIFKFCPFLCYQLISEHFGVNRVTLVPMIAKSNNYSVRKSLH